MARALKISLWVLLALVALFAVAVFAATRLIDPNDFKPQLSELAHKQANLELRIPGELAWTFWPSLGVTIGRTETRIPGHEQLFAGVDEAHVSVAVWPLLFGQVQMDGVRIDGLDMNLEQTADGANWEQIGPTKGATPSEKTAPDATAGDEPESPVDIPVTIPELAITNGRVTYRDTSAGTDILVQQFNLTAREVALKQDFPLSLSLRYQDQSDIRVDVELTATAMLDLNNNHYRLAPMNLTTEVAGVTANPVTVNLQQKLNAWLDDEKVSAESLVLRGGGTTTRGNITVTGFDNPALSGELHTAAFDANDTLKQLGMTPIATSDPSALGKVAVDAVIGGDPGSVILEPLTLTLDESTLEGRAGITSLESLAMVFDLKLDRIRVDRYLPPEADTGGEDTPATAQGGEATRALSTEPLLPLDTIRELNIDGRFTAGEVLYQTLEAGEIALTVTARDGLVELKELSGRALDGSFSANGQLDARQDQPQMSWQHQVKGMQVQPAVKLALEKDLLKGLLSMSASARARGNSEKALMDSATGKASLDFTEGTLRGVNFHNVLVRGINDMLGAYQTLTTLLPEQESGKLPRELSEDTHIVDLHAESHLEKKVAYVDKLNAELRKGTLTGNGWFNIDNNQFDFSLGMKSPEFSDNKYFAGRTWPIRCEGNLDGDAADWCGPDSKGFRKMGKDIAAQAAKEKVKEKLGVEAEGDTAEEVIKNAAEEKAKEEARKKLEEKVEEKLKSLFN